MPTTHSSYVSLGQLRVHKAWIILIGCCFLQAATLAPLMGCQGNFVIPICDELGCGRSEISVYITAYFLSMIPALPICGKILAKYNLRVVTSICTLIVALFAALMATYTQPWMWIISGVAFGTFGCCVFTIPLVTMIGNWFHKKTGIAMGIATAASALAIAVLSPVLQQCIATFGWRAAYLVEAAIVLAFALPWCLFVFRAEPKDWGAVPYGMDKQVNEELQERTGLDFMANPGVPLRQALRSVPFIMLFLFAGIAAMIGSGFDSHLPGYANSLDLSASYGAYLVSALSLGSFCEKLLMGWVNDRFGVWYGVTCEFVLVAIGIVGLIVLRNPVALLVCTFCFGVQDSFTSVSLPLLVKKVFGRLDYTEIFSWTRMGAGIFGSFAAMLVGLVYDVSGSYVPAFIGALGLVAAGGVLVAVAHATMGSLIWVDGEGNRAEMPAIRADDNTPPIIP